MVIGLLEVSLSIPESHSLKDKRRVLRSLKDRVINRMNVSVGEVGSQDLWNFAEMAFVTVAAEKKVVERRLADLCGFLRSDPRCVLTHVSTELL
jgi:hypothetical protein